MVVIIRPPILQVALDFTDIDTAIEIAKKAVMGGADWLECGTPLIKSIGVKAISRLKSAFHNIPIVADMKTMDTGRLEASLAFSNGADIVSVLGVASDETIRSAVEIAKEYGGLIMVDMINHPDPISRAIELKKYGVDIILLHVGIDQQIKGADPLSNLPDVKKSVDCYVAVAGGIDMERAGIAVEMGADVVIIGRYITRAKNVEEVTRQVKSVMIGRKHKAIKNF